MRKDAFEGQLERLAKTLTEQFGVRVICPGEEARTDGAQIAPPSLPEPVEDALERMVVGFLDHEMAHVHFSHFEKAARFSKKHPGSVPDESRRSFDSRRAHACEKLGAARVRAPGRSPANGSFCSGYREPGVASVLEAR